MIMFPCSMRAQYYLPIFQKHKPKLESTLSKFISPQKLLVVIDDILFSLSQEIDQILLPTIAKEIFLVKSNNGLMGNSPQSRYDSFFIQNNKWTYPAREIPLKYPFLFEIVEKLIYSTVNNICRCLVRLEQDFADIILWIGSEIGDLLNVEVSSGDRHRNGQQVLILNFTSKKRIVYKPTNLLPDKLFGNFINLLELKYPFDLHYMKVLPRDDYGWLEYINSLPCHTLSEIKNYYRRAGALLAITDTLNYTDGHFENLIANGAYPVLLDGETLFQCMGDIPDHVLGERSILFTGLVQSADAESKGRGLNAAFQVRGTMRNQYLYTHPINDHTDDLQVRFRGVNNGPSKNCPIYKGFYHTPLKFINEFVEGFTKTYDYISSISNKILDNNSWWDELSNVRVRQLIRHTMYYTFLLRKIQQPEGCISKKSAAEIIRPLLESQDSFVNLLVDYEIKDLLNLNIPYFYLYPGKKDLFDSENKCYTNFVNKASIEEMRNQLKQRTIKYRNRQIEILKTHLPYSPEPVEVENIFYEKNKKKAFN